jgi:hypothetical protein
MFSLDHDYHNPRILILIPILVVSQYLQPLMVLLKPVHSLGVAVGVADVQKAEPGSSRCGRSPAVIRLSPWHQASSDDSPSNGSVVNAVWPSSCVAKISRTHGHFPVSLIKHGIAARKPPIWRESWFSIAEWFLNM